MPQATPEELKKKLDEQVDKLNNKEYETPTELMEIKKKMGVNTDELSPDSIDLLAADVDEMKKSLDDLIEKQKEATGDLPVKEPDLLEGAHLGGLFKELREATHYGKAEGPILRSMELTPDQLKSDGVVVPEKLMRAFWNSALKTTGYLEEGQGSLGGFTVAEQFVPTLLSIPLQEPIVRSRAWNIPTTTNVIKIPRINDTTHAENVYGGVTGNWTAEGASISVSNPAFAQCVLMAKKLALLTYASNELLEDNAVGLNQVLTRLFAEALGWFEDKAFIKGSGVNEPLGLLNAPCLDSVSIATGSVFRIEDACKMYANLLPGSEARAIWIMNPSVKQALPQMLTLGSATAGAPNIWYPAALSIKDSPEPWRLLGIPIFWSEHLAALGTDQDVILTDLSYYILMSRQGIRASVSTESRFANDETGYKLTERTDGQPWPSSTLTLADGATTVSPIVASDHA